MAKILRSHLDAAVLRQSQQDAKTILNALNVDGNIVVVDDPEVEVEMDDEGNELPAPPRALPDLIEVEIESAEAEEEAPAAKSGNGRRKKAEAEA